MDDNLYGNLRRVSNARLESQRVHYIYKTDNDGEWMWYKAKYVNTSRNNHAFTDAYSSHNGVWNHIGRILFPSRLGMNDQYTYEYYVNDAEEDSDSESSSQHASIIPEESYNISKVDITKGESIKIDTCVPGVHYDLIELEEIKYKSVEDYLKRDKNNIALYYNEGKNVFLTSRDTIERTIKEKTNLYYGCTNKTNWHHDENYVFFDLKSIGLLNVENHLCYFDIFHKNERQQLFVIRNDVKYKNGKKMNFHSFKSLNVALAGVNAGTQAVSGWHCQTGIDIGLSMLYMGTSITGNCSVKTATPKSKTPKSRTPKSRTPKSRTPKLRTPKSRTPKSRTPKSRKAKSSNIRNKSHTMTRKKNSMYQKSNKTI